MADIIFDVLFLDTTSTKYYDRTTLEKEALGGTEASVVRVAEGLGKMGLNVAVMQSRIPYFEPVMGQHCFFVHSDDAPNYTTRNYVQIRRNSNPHIFKGAKKYIWLHDKAVDDEESEKTWVESLKECNTTLIGVSRWHKNNIKDVTEYTDVDYIYNPVPDQIFAEPDQVMGLEYNPNVMVWMSSPHKGLTHAIEVFKKVKARNDKMQLIVFNPGYLNVDIMALSTIPGISVYGPMSCGQVWTILKKSLCVFYPTDYEETFGLIAAEANALGTPILCYRNAGLKESVTGDSQFVELGDEEGLIQKALDWSATRRPIVIGNDMFRESMVVLEWVKLLAERTNEGRRIIR